MFPLLKRRERKRAVGWGDELIIRPDTPLSAAQKKQLAKAIRRAKRDGKIASTAQQTIPYEEMYENGVCSLGNRLYSKSIAFEDRSYVGWGGIPQAFDEANEKWASECAELKTLLTPEEYASARGSTLNAHFTSPTVIEGMYQALERMGVYPDTILEPAMGVGNFFGLLPESMQNATLMGVELDSITGRLAKQLYPQANITVDGFERVNLSDNSIDLAVGNVPFGSYKLADPRYDKQNLLIHDYFFVKTLDKVRPGGIVAFITSKGTLDKQDSTVREYLAQRADILGAVRLPNNAFSRNAGTDVTTDILFLQKRAQPPEQVPDWVHLGQTADGIPINRYFETHPDMVLGTMAWDKSMYGNERETTCAPLPGIELADQLSEALSKLSPPDQQLLSQKGAVEVPELLERMETADVEARNFSYTEVGGKLYFVEDGERIPVEVPATTEKRIRGMIGLRDVTRNLIELQLYGGTDEEIRTAQEKLGKAYDAYTAEYGLLNSTGNKRAFEQDSSYCLLCSLEVLDEDGNLERKADMFTKRTINHQVTIDHVDTASEALAVSIGERARVDLDYAAYRKTSPREKPRFRAAHEAELLLHEAAKRAFDEFGEKKLPTVKTLQAEYSDLLAKKKAAYEDYKRLRKENQELQTVKANVDALLRIEQVQEYQREKENNQEQGR